MTSATSTLPPEPARQLRRWHTWLVVWRVHRWLGLGCGALLVLLSASGSLLVVHHELEHWFEHDRHTATPPAVFEGRQPTLTDLARQVASATPAGYRLFRIVPAAGADATHRLIFRAPDAPVRWVAFVNPWNGAVVWSGPEKSLLTPWLLGLHMQLHAGRAGYWVTGVAGVGLALLSLTGLCIHRDRLTQLWRHPVQLHLGWRVAVADLHKWIGIFALYFPIVLGATGAFLCLSILLTPQAEALAATFDPAQLAPLEPMFATARERLPDAEIFRAQLPAQTGGAVTVLLLHRNAPVWAKFSRVEFDAGTGALRTVRAAADAPLSARFRAMFGPLHFGFYGAPWVKWAYFIGGLSPALLALSGAAIWWLRRRAATRTPHSSAVVAAPPPVFTEVA